MNANWKTWPPFQSQTIKKICANMSSSEKNAAAMHAATYGIWVAATFALPVGAVIAFQNVITTVAAVFLIVIHLACIPAWRCYQKRFLCSTKWAKENGYTPESIK